MEREYEKIENPISSSNYKGLNHFLCIYIYSNGNKNHQKWVLLRDTCDYPTTSNAYFTRVSEPKLSDDMKEENIFCVLDTKNTPTNCYNC